MPGEHKIKQILFKINNLVYPTSGSINLQQKNNKPGNIEFDKSNKKKGGGGVRVENGKFGNTITKKRKLTLGVRPLRPVLRTQEVSLYEETR